ncbi:septal ring lytic transglycosylase RlpA family protein [Oxynema sp. CENA135]|uniref:septal ring lytic transglycosylase RlpA family protein n=1 Tax=Oxynema sp. CENA135 TaxID=984206 RepID=UPI00190CBAF2|nr:septal ring lytic transglycosylase RlpA family protein [Oxynema sp. CENA135]MBK4728600.1 septal ring lytic transglycosylase RlpA family protein [Oxynema sp. CENA135]
MKQRFWWTTAVVLVTAFGATSSSHAQQNRPVDGSGEPSLSASPSGDRAQPQAQTVSSEVSELQARRSTDAIELGEYPSETEAGQSEILTKIHRHQFNGRSAATLYVRDLPVVTFLGTAVNRERATATVTKVAAAPDDTGATTKAEGAEVKPVARGTYEEFERVTNIGTVAPSALSLLSRAIAANSEVDRSDPVWRASAIAAKLNQIERTNAPVEIALTWNGLVDKEGEIVSESYLIKVDDEALLVVDENTRLPDTTANLEQDALQMTNRLRRLVADAAPLSQVANKPKPKPKAPEIVTSPVQFVVNGWASWYGPGFHGRLSASGEVFDQNALTAAHRTLPFGTEVRVTNLNNGRSIVVRINDRGPFVGNRVIDLSAAAAQVLGMMDTGVAPVRLDILGGRRTASNVR